MNAILFFLEDSDLSPEGLVSPISKIRRLSISYRSLGVDKIIMVDKTRYRAGKYYTHSSESVEFEYYDDILEVLHKYSSMDIFVLDLFDNILNNNRIPTHVSTLGENKSNNSLFIVGPDSGSWLSNIDFEEMCENINWIYIPCSEPNVLFAEHALTIALYEFRKEV